jgi:hypothetical protein
VLATSKKVRVLAFICAFKHKYNNSIISTDYTTNYYASSLKIKSKTFTDYIQLLKELNLIKPLGSNLQILSIKDCLNALYPDGTIGKYHSFFKSHKGKINNKESILKQFQFIIQQSCMVRYVKKCHYKINDKVRLSKVFHNGSPNTDVSRILRKAKKVYEVEPSQINLTNLKLNRSIYFGKHLLSSYLGCSPTTASRFVTKLIKQKKLKRTKVVKAVEHQDMFEGIKSKRVFWHTKMNCYVSCIGSKIDSISMLDYKLTDKSIKVGITALFDECTKKRKKKVSRFSRWSTLSSADKATLLLRETKRINSNG